MDHPQPLSRFNLSFQTKNTILTTNKCEKMSIQYSVLGFEPTTFGHESPPITTSPGFKYGPSLPIVICFRPFQSNFISNLILRKTHTRIRTHHLLIPRTPLTPT